MSAAATPLHTRSGPRTGWVLVRADGLVTAVDPDFTSLVGAPNQAALVGRSWPSLVTLSSAHRLREAERAVAAGQPWSGALELLFADRPVELQFEVLGASLPEDVVLMRAVEIARAATPQAVPAVDAGESAELRALVAAMEAVEKPSRCGRGGAVRAPGAPAPDALRLGGGAAAERRGGGGAVYLPIADGGHRVRRRLVTAGLRRAIHPHLRRALAHRRARDLRGGFLAAGRDCRAWGCAPRCACRYTAANACSRASCSTPTSRTRSHRSTACGSTASSGRSGGGWGVPDRPRSGGGRGWRRRRARPDRA